MAESWWRPLSEEGRLSQGDIVSEVTFGALTQPRLPLIKSGGSGQWKEVEWTPDQQGYCHCLARARVATAVVLTHSCQLDKKERASRVVVAPVASADRLDGAARDLVFAGLRISLVPLPDIPGFGDGYADLRIMTAIDRKTIDQLQRVATMKDGPTKELQARIVAFFARDGVPAARV